MIIQTRLVFNLPFSDMKVSLPFFACPTAGNRMFHTEGELATAKVKTNTKKKKFQHKINIFHLKGSQTPQHHLLSLLHIYNRFPRLNKLDLHNLFSPPKESLRSPPSFHQNTQNFSRSPALVLACSIPRKSCFPTFKKLN